MLESELNLTALEGPPFSGKTTVIDKLKMDHRNQTVVIPEAGEYVGGDKNFPSVPFNTFHDAKASTHFFVAAEEKRTEDIRRAYETTGLPIIMDRSTPISSLVFYMLLEEKHPELHRFHESFYRYGFDVFQNAVDKGTILLPKRIIYVQPGDEETFKARIPRGASTNIFQQWDTFLYLHHLYLELIDQNYPGELSTLLKSFNGSDPLNELTGRILQFAQQYDKHLISKGIIYDFRRDEFDTPHNLDLDKEREIYSYMHERAKHLMMKAYLDPVSKT